MFQCLEEFGFHCIIAFILQQNLSQATELDGTDAKKSLRSYNKVFLPSIADTKTTIFRILVGGNCHARVLAGKKKLQYNENIQNQSVNSVAENGSKLFM